MRPIESHIAVLGPVGLRSDDGFIAVHGHQGALLAVLAANYPNSVEQDRVIAALWPVSAPVSAKRGLGVALHRLRNRLRDPNMIITEGNRYRLNVRPEELDASLFEAQMDLAGSEVSDARVERLTEALGLWRGRPFQPVGDDPAFTAASSELVEQKRLAEEQLLESLLEVGRTREAANRAASFVEAEPYRERRWELLMLALYRSSRQAEALRAGQRARRTLGDDLGLEPGPELRRLEAAILRQDPSLAGSDSGPSTQFDHLIESVDAVSPTVPVYNSTFVGRDDEIAVLSETIENHPWVAVHGPPGVGKTRLVSRYCFGDSQRRIIWLEGDDRDAREVRLQLASHLNVRPDPKDDFAGALPALTSEPTLLVIDNPCESTVALVPRIVSAKEIVRVVTITRPKPSDVSSRFDLPLTGLDNDAAATLLLTAPGLGDQATAARVIDEIGTMPLHVELFAAQLNFASVDELLEDWRGPIGHVDDALARALDWSVEYVSEAERALYEQFSVFAGWTSASDIAGGVNLPVALVRKQLSALISAGLVRSSRTGAGNGHVRYRLDLSMRSHAMERLVARDGLAEARALHGNYFFTVALECGRQAAGPDEQAAVGHLHSAAPQLHIVLAWLLETGDSERAVEFVLALREYAFFRLDFDTMGWADRVADAPGAKASDNYPELVSSAALSSWACDRMSRAQTQCDEAIAEASERGLATPITAMRARLNVAATRNDPHVTVEAMSELMRAADDRGTVRDIADCHVNNAIGATFVGDATAAMDAAMRSLELAEGSENPTSIAWAKYAVGCAELLVHPDPALVNFAEALRLARTVQNRWVISSALSGVATAARLGGRARDAAGPLLSLLDIWIGLRKERFFARTLNEIALVLVELEHREAARTVLGWAGSYTADRFLLPEDRARLRQAVSELPPPLVSDLFESRDQAAGAKELLVSAGAMASTRG